MNSGQNLPSSPSPIGPIKRIREGFPNQRLTILPESAIERCRSLPVVQQLYVTHIGSYQTAPFHHVERPEGVPQAILIYCLRGRGWLNIANQTHSVLAGQAILIPPLQAHTYQASQKDPWSIFWIHFNGPLTDSILESFDYHLSSPVINSPDIEQIKEAFESTYSCTNYNYSDSGLFTMTAEFMGLLSKLKLHAGRFQQDNQQSGASIRKTISFMERHLDLTLSLEELAQQAGLSIPHYSKLFREHTNQSPISYFLQLKIRKACDLLYQTEQPIIHIARALGYDDPYYFSRLFKKVQGCSPSQFRERERKY
ncbi:AraC family transcriptional regulator [Pelagicoccus mobilis]|uniref:AraC family transcriptional regulator n=1 Tax=Pelagicoccus mobilis TaxID=415221 RepID=A0A934RXZ3_9BACT|nr:AraC family transcriptional regulator [Pelagicoccus mobilis]MBK1875934.1 AraC family transcriptional regulator [Pelagicoccus mobilis]